MKFLSFTLLIPLVGGFLRVVRGFGMMSRPCQTLAARQHYGNSDLMCGRGSSLLMATSRKYNFKTTLEQNSERIVMSPSRPLSNEPRSEARKMPFLTVAEQRAVLESRGIPKTSIHSGVQMVSAVELFARKPASPFKTVTEQAKLVSHRSQATIVRIDAPTTTVPLNVVRKAAPFTRASFALSASMSPFKSVAEQRAVIESRVSRAPAIPVMATVVTIVPPITRKLASPFKTTSQQASIVAQRREFSATSTKTASASTTPTNTLSTKTDSAQATAYIPTNISRQPKPKNPFMNVAQQRAAFEMRQPITSTNAKSSAVSSSSAISNRGRKLVISTLKSILLGVRDLMVNLLKAIVKSFALSPSLKRN